MTPERTTVEAWTSVPGLGHLVPGWSLYFLVPFVAILLVASRVWQVRDRRRQAVRRENRLLRNRD